MSRLTEKLRKENFTEDLIKKEKNHKAISDKIENFVLQILTHTYRAHQNDFNRLLSDPEAMKTIRDFSSSVGFLRRIALHKKFINKSSVKRKSND